MKGGVPCFLWPRLLKLSWLNDLAGTRNFAGRPDGFLETMRAAQSPRWARVNGANALAARDFRLSSAPGRRKFYPGGDFMGMLSFCPWQRPLPAPRRLGDPPQPLRTAAPAVLGSLGHGQR